MASPQCEDGFTRIANEIVEHLCRVNLSAYESRVLWFIFRKTYGWDKRLDRLSISQISNATELDRGNASRALTRLKKRNMILTEGDQIGFQKDFEKWGCVCTDTPPVSQETLCLSVHQKCVSTYNKGAVRTNTTTDKEQKDRNRTGNNGSASLAPKKKKHVSPADEHFEQAWSRYPKRAGDNSKTKAVAAWNARLRDGVDPTEMLAGVQRYAEFVRATGKENTEFVKQAATFFGPHEHWKEAWQIPVDRQSRAMGGFVG